MSQPFVVKKRSEQLSVSDFDETFSQFQPGLPAESVSGRIQYTQHLLRFADNRNSEFWYATQSGSPNVIARLGADLRASEGTIGFLEAQSTNDGSAAALELLDLATQWLGKRGAKLVYGPADFNSWFNYRLKLQQQSGLNESNHPWEPRASIQHEELFQSSGFKESLQYSSYFFDLKDVTQWKLHMGHLRADYSKALDSGFRIRSLHKGQEISKDVHAIFEISNIAFSNQPLFEQIPYELFSAITLPALTQFNANPSRICIDKNGKAVGFLFAFLLNDLIVYKSVAVLPEFQTLGIGNAMTMELCQFGYENQKTRCVGALIRHGNRSEMFGKSFEKIVKSSGRNDYILLSRAI